MNAQDLISRVVDGASVESLLQSDTLDEAAGQKDLQAMAKGLKAAFDKLSAEEKERFAAAYLKNPKAASDHLFQSIVKGFKE